jgi:fatty acid desaturase
MVESIVIGSLCVMGVYAAMGEGMVLEWMQKFLEKISNKNALRLLRPALYECPICMASFWGTVFWLIMGAPVFWLTYVFAVAGLNYIIVNATGE